MSTRLTFDLSTVIELAEHAATAAAHSHPAGAGHTGPALLLSSNADGSWLSSNGLPALPAPAGQPGTLDRPAAFAHHNAPATPQPQHIAAASTDSVLRAVLPLAEPTDHPLLEQLRAGTTAGATTLIVLLSGIGLDLAVGRHRDRTRSHRTTT